MSDRILINELQISRKMRLDAIALTLMLTTDQAPRTDKTLYDINSAMMDNIQTDQEMMRRFA